MCLLKPSLVVKRLQPTLKYFRLSGSVKRTVQSVHTRQSVPSMRRFKLIVTVEECERVTFGLAVPRIRFLFTTVYCSSRFNFYRALNLVPGVMASMCA